MGRIQYIGSIPTMIILSLKTEILNFQKYVLKKY